MTPAAKGPLMLKELNVYVNMKRLAIFCEICINSILSRKWQDKFPETFYALDKTLSCMDMYYHCRINEEPGYNVT